MVAEISDPSSPPVSTPSSPEEEPADQRTDDADDQVLDPTGATSLDQLPGQPTGRQTDQEKQDDIHDPGLR